MQRLYLPLVARCDLVEATRHPLYTPHINRHGIIDPGYNPVAKAAGLGRAGSLIPATTFTGG